MHMATMGPLDDLDEAALYKLLGDAWYAQLKLEKGEACFLESSAATGKREFDALLPMLQKDLARPCHFGVAACVTDTIKRSGTWRMPGLIVAALALRRGLANQAACPLTSTNAPKPEQMEQA